MMVTSEKTNGKPSIEDLFASGTSDLGDIPSGFDSDSSLTSLDSNVRSSRHASPRRPSILFENDPPKLKRKPLKLENINQTDRSGRTPIFLYCSRGDVDAVRQLIDAGADLNIRDYAGWTPLHEAGLNGMVDVVKLLIKFGGDVNATALNGDTPLHDAAENDFEDVCETLLKAGAYLHAKNHDGKTPLDVCSKDGDAFKVLSEWDQKIIKCLNREKNGTTALHHFAAIGDLQGVREALDFGTDVTVKDNAGWTPLHEACLNGMTQVALVLLQHGAKVDAQGLDGDTPLMDAVENHHLSCVQLLLKWGANPTLKNLEGKSSLDIAKDEMLQVLTKPLEDWQPIQRPTHLPRPVGQHTEFKSLSKNVYLVPEVDISSPRAMRGRQKKRDPSSEPESTTGSNREKTSLSTGFGWYNQSEGLSREERKMQQYLKMIEKQEGKKEKVEKVEKKRKSPKKLEGDWLDDEQIAIINKQIEAFEKHRDSTSDNEDWEVTRKRRRSSSRGPTREGRIPRRKIPSGKSGAKLQQLLESATQSEEEDEMDADLVEEMEQRAKERERLKVQQRKEQERREKEREKKEKERREREKKERELAKEREKKREEDRAREKREAEKREIERQRELRELQSR